MHSCHIRKIKVNSYIQSKLIQKLYFEPRLPTIENFALQGNFERKLSIYICGMVRTVAALSIIFILMPDSIASRYSSDWKSLIRPEKE